MYISKHETTNPGDAPGLGNAVSPTAIKETSLPDQARPVTVHVVPVTEKIPIPGASPYALFRALQPEKGYILESMEGLPRRAVRSIVGLAPECVFTIGEDVSCEGKRYLSDIFDGPGGKDPISSFRRLSGQFRYGGPSGTDFYGGLVGYCSYDLVTRSTGGLVQAGEDEDVPFVRLMLSTRGIVYNHVEASCTLFDDLLITSDTDQEEEHAKACERISSLKRKIMEVPAGEISIPAERQKNINFSATPSRKAFEGMVRKAREHIMAGDIFQVVLSRKIRSPFAGDPLRIYGAVRTINPSPYLYCLQFGDEAVIGSSPEMLLRVLGRTITTVPIAGTRPRGRTDEEDESLARELLNDEKECAEHLMLVDLARNDIGRVAAFGSVALPEFYTVEKFSHVQHIVSRVEGTLAEGLDRFDALSSCFPAGTVSGAPKIRAMQIIARLEAEPRGLYAGAVGYAGFNDILEFAIAIRTLRVSKGIAEFSTGAGIVADSIPENEFDETEFKARAMIGALEGAGEES
jgi:anthranilate synthase component 1